MNIRSIAILILFCGILISSCQKKNPVVEIQTPKGNILVELYMDKAPVTAGNFLKLVEDGVYDGASFYRTVRQGNDSNPISISVIQGGISHKQDRVKVARIEHEHTDTTGLKHLDGTISMARGRPGSASSEFFICMGDQPELDYRGRRNSDRKGFAAFGQVIEGFKVCRDIWGSPAAGQDIDPQIRIHKMEIQ
ncbi:MAG: peptidylprolyl isomerase [Bacteroidetes bacterium]|nr:peptidylprolyl isomerase [Bacteroidota bacterium]MBT4399391.1 peptidylprolyl isomerase [Bacteroidota bacterium]MBT4409790.1 peptidylprolyl isomerase [Bacteroidota bacterium]MBT5424610.1 peptidylprolyl isomerase [Bacteroidota bacterium]MBT7095213.1 peptidylprolyl isomerase [Bacteroidota bacterium]